MPAHGNRLRRKPKSGRGFLDSGPPAPYSPPLNSIEGLACARAPQPHGIETMKVRSSLKSLKSRHRDCKLVRRKGVLYVINKTDPRFKAKQG